MISVILALAGPGAALLGGAGAEEDAMAVFQMSKKGETCIQVCPGEKFAIQFRTTPGTGYGWVFAAEPDKRFLEFIGEEMGKSGSGLLGGSELVTWTFRALEGGDAEISLKYVRPWEKDAEPAQQHVFRVKIGLPCDSEER